jgi:hypothetical protein
MAQGRSLSGMNGTCTQKNSGSPWVPGCPTDSISAAAVVEYRFGTDGPSMAADRTTAGRKFNTL